MGQAQLIRRLFPFYVAFDSGGVVHGVGDHLVTALGAPHPERIEALLRLRRPDVPFDYAVLTPLIGTPLVAEVVGAGWELRGQLELIDGLMHFLGFPWIANAEELAKRGVLLHDFPPHSGIPDMLMLFQSQRMSLSDVERLNTRLRKKGIAHEALLSGVPDTILHLDETGCLSNFKLSPTVGLSFQTLRPLGCRLPELFAGELGRALEELRARVGSEPLGPRETDLRIEVDGRVREFEVRLSPSESNHVFMVVRDVTQRKELERELVRAREEALAASRTKSRFLATMSHELRTPLNGVIGLTELLRQTSLSHEQREYVARLDACGAALLEMVNDVLDVSKAEAGAISLAPGDFSVREVVDDVVAILWQRAKSAGLRLSRHVSGAFPALVRGDKQRFRQLVLNLSSNAVKFTSTGEVRIELHAEERPDGRPVIVCKVVDTGSGIPRAAQSRLFQPFVQLDSATTRRYEGTGLGLSICKAVVELMHGEIGVESEQGVGSTFWFRVPFEHVSQPEAGAASFLSNKLVILAGGTTESRALASSWLHAWGGRCVEEEQAKLLTVLRSGLTQRDPAWGVLLLDDGTKACFELAREVARLPVDVRPRLLLGDIDAGEEHEEVDALLLRPLRQSSLQDALADLLMGPQARAEAELRAAQPTDQGSVLVVDDNSTNRLVLANLLSKRGFAVREAASGAQAVTACARAPCPLIFMDIQMPEMDGFEATDKIRALGFATDIVAVTANAMEGDREECLRRGMNYYLAKPVRIAELERLLARLGAGKRRSRPAPSLAPPKPMDGQLSLTTLAETSGGDAELDFAFLTGVARDLPELLERAQRTLAEGNLAAARIALHSAKGLTRTVSDGELPKILASLEAYAQQPEATRAGAETQLTRAAALSDALLQEIRQHLSGLAVPA